MAARPAVARPAGQRSSGHMQRWLMPCAAGQPVCEPGEQRAHLRTRRVEGSARAAVRAARLAALVALAARRCWPCTVAICCTVCSRPMLSRRALFSAMRRWRSSSSADIWEAMAAWRAVGDGRWPLAVWRFERRGGGACGGSSSTQADGSLGQCSNVPNTVEARPTRSSSVRTEGGRGLEAEAWARGEWRARLLRLCVASDGLLTAAEWHGRCRGGSQFDFGPCCACPACPGVPFAACRGFLRLHTRLHCA